MNPFLEWFKASGGRESGEEDETSSSADSEEFSDCRCLSILNISGRDCDIVNYKICLDDVMGDKVIPVK